MSAAIYSLSSATVTPVPDVPVTPEVQAPVVTPVPVKAEKTPEQVAEAAAKVAADKAALAEKLVQAKMTADALVNDYVGFASFSESFDAKKRWEWAGKLRDLLDNLANDKQRTVTSAEIGAAIAEGLDRRDKDGNPNPYKGSWVRQHANAASKFPNEPSTREEYRAFMNAVNGNAGPSKTAPANTPAEGDAQDGEPTEGDAPAPDPLKTFRAMVRKLKGLNFTEKDLIDALKFAYKS